MNVKCMPYVMKFVLEVKCCISSHETVLSMQNRVINFVVAGKFTPANVKLLLLYAHQNLISSREQSNYIIKRVYLTSVLIMYSRHAYICLCVCLCA